MICTTGRRGAGWFSFYLQQNDFINALTELEKVLEFDPNNPDAHLRIGLIYVEQKRYKEAADQFVRVLMARPDDAKVRYYLGTIYEEIKESDKAIKEYKRGY